MNALFLIFYLWTIGLFLSFLFLLLIVLGRIEVKGYNRIRKLLSSKEGLIVISNHPSLWEPVILPFLFFPYFLFFPKMIPFSTPDKKNLYDKWWFVLFRPVCIPIEREKKRKANSLRRLFRAIKERKTIILFPEGGRTFKGEEFKIIKNDGKIVIERRNWQEVEARFPGMPKIRRFQREVKGLLKHVQIFLPTWIWIEKKVRLKIRIGEPVQIQNIEIEELENTLLKLGAV